MRERNSSVFVKIFTSCIFYYIYCWMCFYYK